MPPPRTEREQIAEQLRRHLEKVQLQGKQR